MGTVDDVRRLAATLPEVTEAERRGGSSWVVRGKAFAWMRPFSKADLARFADQPVPEGPILALATDGLEEKEALLQMHPEYLFTIPHFDGYASVLLRLDKTDESELRAALQDAWLAHAPAHLADRYLAGGER